MVTNFETINVGGNYDVTVTTGKAPSVTRQRG